MCTQCPSSRIAWACPFCAHTQSPVFINACPLWISQDMYTRLVKGVVALCAKAARHFQYDLPEVLQLPLDVQKLLLVCLLEYLPPDLPEDQVCKCLSLIPFHFVHLCIVL